MRLCRSAPATLSSRAGSTRTAATSGRPRTGPTARWSGPRRSATSTRCPTCWSASARSGCCHARRAPHHRVVQSALQHGRRPAAPTVALQQLAVGYALAGNEVACQRALDTAAQLAERSQQEQDEGPGRYCTPAMSRSSERRPGSNSAGPSAIDLFEDSLATPSVHRRDRGAWPARLASAMPWRQPRHFGRQGVGGLDRRAGNRVAAHHHRTQPAWEPATLGVHAAGQPATQGVEGGMNDRPPSSGSARHHWMGVGSRRRMGPASGSPRPRRVPMAIGCGRSAAR